MRRKKMAMKILHYALVILVLVVTLFPFYVMLTTAFKTSEAAVAYPPQIIPKDVTLQHFKDVLNPRIFPFGRYFLNSFKIALTTAGIAIVVGSMAAYSLSRLVFPGRIIFKESTLVVYMFSGILLVVPLFKIVSSIGLNDSMWAVVIADLVSTLPAAIYMLSGYFETIPESLEEAAMIDGLSRFQVIYKIVLPLSVPAISSAFIYVFMIAWNDFLFSFTFLSSQEKLTLSVGLKQLFGSMDYVWGRMMAAALLTAIPVIITFSAVEKFISGGLTAGGEKG
ncbi:MAG: carbohydrate ABC transporter permease [Lachnospiraceae bacterium]|nr:carbohydrate ABC transporter permease [Lachnospiraceae bacterium]